jgi:hypothetical protein
MFSENPDKTLPVCAVVQALILSCSCSFQLSHTCFFELELPEYSSFDVLRQKIVYAITECEAIDTDFNPNNADMWEAE